MTKDEMIEAIKGMTVLELSELVKSLEETFGVSAAAMATAAVAQPGAAAAADGGGDAGEQTEFTVTLTEIGSNKIGLIKIVREITSLGLKEAKGLVESAPNAAIKEGVSKEDADKVKAQLEEAGGKATIS